MFLLVLLTVVSPNSLRFRCGVLWENGIGRTVFAVTAMLASYALEDRSPWFVLAFVGSCALGSAYGFLQGAWPFGVVEAIWALIALHRWQSRFFAN